MTTSQNDAINTHLSKNIEIISIEGNIGSGKTTFLSYLKDKLKNFQNVLFVDEPVDEWNEIKDGETTLLQKFYEDNNKYAFQLQIVALTTKLMALTKAIETANHLLLTYKRVYIITERSLYTDKFVFAKMLYDNGIMNSISYSIYNKYFAVDANIYATKIIYIKTDPNNCHNRINVRNRAGEKQIDESYLLNCNKYHEEYISIMEKNNIQIFTINGNKDINETPNLLKNWYINVLNFVNFKTSSYIFKTQIFKSINNSNNLTYLNMFLNYRQNNKNHKNKLK